MKIKTRYILTFILCSFFSLQNILAAEVLNVKGGKALLDISDLSSLNANDKVFAINSEGKKKALLEIKQIKGNKAVAEIKKGQAEVGMKLSLPANSKNITKNESKENIKSKHRNAYGGLAGYNMNSMKVKISAADSVSLSGSSFSAKGFFQQHLDGPISVRLGAGYETLSGTGTLASGNCGGSTDCNTSISYLGLDAVVRYTLDKGRYNPWLGGGLGFLIALSKSSNALDQSKILTNQTLLAATGIDYSLSPTKFIPIELVYAIFPSNSTVSVSQFILRFGYATTY